MIDARSGASSLRRGAVSATRGRTHVSERSRESSGQLDLADDCGEPTACCRTPGRRAAFALAPWPRLKPVDHRDRTHLATSRGAYRTRGPPDSPPSRTRLQRGYVRLASPDARFRRGWPETAVGDEIRLDADRLASGESPLAAPTRGSGVPKFSERWAPRRRSGVPQPARPIRCGRIRGAPLGRRPRRDTPGLFERR